MEHLSGGVSCFRFVRCDGSEWEFAIFELIATKLSLPQPRAELISRPRLTGRLQVSSKQKLTLISAPAGFGKTTLVGEWINHSKRRVAWVSLDAGDNDPADFGAILSLPCKPSRAIWARMLWQCCNLLSLLPPW